MTEIPSVEVDSFYGETDTAKLCAAMKYANAQVVKPQLIFSARRWNIDLMHYVNCRCKPVDQDTRSWVVFMSTGQAERLLAQSTPSAYLALQDRVMVQVNVGLEIRGERIRANALAIIDRDITQQDQSLQLFSVRTGKLVNLV